MGQLQEYQKLQQDPSHKILDDHPIPAADMLPIPLLYDCFGHFLDIVDGLETASGMADVKVPELQKHVDNLASVMTQYYPSEDLRRDAALPCLWHIFLAHSGTQISELQPAAIGSVRSDGHNQCPLGGGLGTVEFKNEATGINSIPQVEVLGYLMHLNVNRVMHDNAF